MGEAGLDRIAENISLDISKLVRRSHEMIVTLILPERLAGSSQQLVSFSSTVAFQATHEGGRFRARCDEHVHVIRHDHPSMQAVIGEGAVLKAEARNSRLLQMARSETAGAGQPVHSEKGLPGGQRLVRKLPAGGQAAVQPKRHEQRSPDGTGVRQAALREEHDEYSVSAETRKSQRSGSGDPPQA